MEGTCQYQAGGGEQPCGRDGLQGELQDEQPDCVTCGEGGEREGGVVEVELC